MFEILECKFGVTKVKYLITLINASRDGLLETEIIDLLQSSKIVEGKTSCECIQKIQKYFFLFLRIRNKTMDQFLLGHGPTFASQQEH